jgi:hypothetical protein
MRTYSPGGLAWLTAALAVVAFALGVWWTWLPFLFSVPWVAAIAWVRLRRDGCGTEVPVSLAEASKRRLWSA